MWWSICDKSSLKIHTKVAHEKLKDHQCEHCEKSFSSKWCFKIHKMTHSDIQERIKCSKCKKKTCSSKRALKVHINIVHDKIKNYQCEDCDQSFYAKAHLKWHVTRIHYDQKVKCNECSMMFGSKSNMERHVSSVHKSIKHKCSECEVKFTQKWALKDHIKKVHEGIKVFLNLHIKTDNS